MYHEDIIAWCHWFRSDGVFVACRKFCSVKYKSMSVRCYTCGNFRPLVSPDNANYAQIKKLSQEKAARWNMMLFVEMLMLKNVNIILYFETKQSIFVKKFDRSLELQTSWYMAYPEKFCAYNDHLQWDFEN